MGQVFKRQIRGDEPIGIVTPVALNVADLSQVLEIANLSFSHPWNASEVEYFLRHPCAFHVGIKQASLRAYCLGLLVGGVLDTVSVATHPAARRCGLASALLGFLKECREVKAIFLEVALENTAAVSTYEKSGFSKLGVRKKYYEGKQDAWVMQWNRGLPNREF